MEKEDWFLNLIAVFLVIAADLITKTLSIQTTSIIDYGIFSVHTVQNFGVMGGNLQHISPMLRIIGVSCFGALIFTIYLFIQYIIPITSSMLRYGLSIMIAGFMGNIIDRILHGSVTDFIQFKGVVYIFNVADLFQWIGFALIIAAFIKHGKAIWPDDDKRNKVWINSNFQIRYLLIQMVVALGLAFPLLTFSYTFLKLSFTEISERPDSKNEILLTFMMSFSILSLIYIIFLMVLSRYLSHKIAGPVYAFQRFLKDALNGNLDRPLKLRPGDEFKELEEVSAEVIKTLKR